MSREQLIALHTHEALHRALPPDIRENEEKVALLTMALTSSSATFDRINRVAQSVLAPPPPVSTGSWLASSFSTTKSPGRSSLTTRPLRGGEVHFEHAYYSYEYSYNMAVEKLGGELPLFEHFEAFGYEADPRLRVDAFLLSGENGFVVGPLGLTLKIPAFYDLGKSFEPFARISLRSLDAERGADRESTSRDVYTVGAMFETQRPSSYSKTSLSYTLPDHFGSSKGISSIWSFDTQQGWKIRRFDLGVAVGLYHALPQTNSTSFSALRAGPEVKWTKGRTSVYLSGSIFSRGVNLDRFQDLVGHGAGTAFVSGGLTVGI